MAKGNLFQGMARGVVGDVVFSRLDGQQVSRVRNRNPRNPKTNAQLYQRAIMATIMQAYSAGKVIFDHSFQGYSVGAANQRRFMSVNAKKLRSAVAADLSLSLAEQTGRVVAPGATSPVPFSYIISEGDYEQQVFDTDGKIAAAADGVSTLADYAAQLGLIEGDYYTIVVYFAYNQSNPVFAVDGVSTDYGKEYPGLFGFVRLKVKDGITTSTDSVPSTVRYSTLFVADEILNVDTSIFMGNAITAGFTIEQLDPTGETPVGGFGIIRSRKDEDLRSNSVIIIPADLAAGIASTYALQAWKQGSAQIGDSDLILEGGNF